MIGLRFRFLAVFGLLNTFMKCEAQADILFQRKVDTQCYLRGNTLKNKTVALGMTMLGYLPETIPLCSHFLFSQLTFSFLFMFVSRTINFTISFSIRINCLWSGHNRMIFLDDFVGCSSSSEDPLGVCYVHNSNHALTLVNSEIKIYRPKLESVYFACFEYRSKLKKSAWVRVASIWGVARYVDGVTVFLMFEASFARVFAPFLLYGSFAKIGIDSFDWLVKRSDFDSVAFEVLRDRVIQFNGGRTKERLNSVITFQVGEEVMPPPVSVDTKLFIDSVWFERWLRVQRELPGCATKVWDSEMFRRWGRRLYKPWELDCRLVSSISLESRPPRCFKKKVTLGEWTFHDWMEFFDLVGGEDDVIGIDVSLANLRKNAYGFPSSWSPLKLIDYCRCLNLPPLGFQVKIPVAEGKTGKLFEPFELDGSRVEELEALRVALEGEVIVERSTRECESDAYSTEQEKRFSC
jgi:hypothetical protein